MESKSLRDAFGDEILEVGRDNKNVYVIDCDISKACKTVVFSKELPEQHINVGIAEQNACGIAAGLATTGKIPFVSTYAVFGSMRMLEQIRQEVCYPNLNVKIACSHGGLTPDVDGPSHQCIEDMGILRTIPGITIIMGGDYNATRQLVRKASEMHGPVYLRFTKDPIPCIYDESINFEIGKAHQIDKGNDITIVANGDVVCLAIDVANELKNKGYSVDLFDMHTIKPLDSQAIIQSVKNTGVVITIEDHNIINGLGSAVSEVLAEEGIGKLKRIGVQDKFAESGPYKKLLELNGIYKDNIVSEALKLIGSKQNLKR